MAKKSKKEEKMVKSEEIQPLMVSDASTYETKASAYSSDSGDSSHTQTRRNVAADIDDQSQLLDFFGIEKFMSIFI
jgi:hypothetical protein